MQNDDPDRGNREARSREFYERPRVSVYSVREVLSDLGPARAVVYDYDPGNGGLG